MSVIQKIRDKYARWAVIAIALSLLGFILMDAFAGRTGLFSNRPSNSIGKVNGTSIDRMAFDKKVKDRENAESQQTPIDDDRRQQIMSTMWDQEVSNIVMNGEYEKLGLTVTEKELRDILYGANPPQDLKQQFTDENGQYNAIAAQQAINQMKKDPAQKQNIENYFDFIRSQRLMSKYMSMLTNTIYFPKWFLEKRNVDNSLLATISFVNVPYTSIPDSSIKISDDEIKNYIKEHKEDYEQKEETRSINFVQFNAAPSTTDSATTKAEVEKLKTEFAASTDPAGFLNQQGSVLPYYDAYVGKSTIQVPNKDTIFTLPKGGVFGPYLDVNPNSNSASYVLAKMVDMKMLPDSVKCRHILLGTVDRQGKPLMSDSLAKFKADSIALAIKNGASFDSLNAKYSTDEAAKMQKGEMTFSSAQIQSEGFAKEFGQFILFDGKPGDKKVVKTQFGWHYIEIMEHYSVEPHYKIAYMAHQIFTSNETDQNAHNQANLFAGNSRDLSSFNANYDKSLHSQGIPKLVAPEIHPMDFQINGVQGNARQFIRKVFETDKGDVLGPEKVGDNYVVAIVTDVNEPGLKSVNAVRPSIEPVLRNKKKAEQIVKNIGQPQSLEQIASKTGQQVQTLDSIRFAGDRKLGYEPKVLGATFNPANKGKLVPEAITGTSGVFVLHVDNVTTTPVETGSIDEQRNMLEMQAKQGLMSQMSQGFNPIVETLKRASNIKDYRAKFY